MALGTLEPSGRVRAGGQYTTPTMYFNLPNKRSKKYHEDLEVKLKEKEAQNEKLKNLVLHVLKEQDETNSLAMTELLSELLKQGPKLVNSLPLENVESNSARSDIRQQVIAKSKQRKDGGQQKKRVSSVKLKSKNVQSKIDNGKSIVDSEKLKAKDRKSKIDNRKSIVDSKKLKAKDGKDQDCRLALAEEHGDRVLLIPFNIGGHWVLMVLDIPSMEVYWLDSLKDFLGLPDPAFKLLVNTAIKTSNMSKGKRKMNPNSNWNYVTVLEFSSKKSYTTEIDELRLEFIDFIQQLI